MDARLRRVNKEIAGEHLFLYTHEIRLTVHGSDCKNDKTSGIRIEMVADSPFHLIGFFPGPEGTPYEGGNFEVVRPISLLSSPPIYISYPNPTPSPIPILPISPYLSLSHTHTPNQDIVIPESYPFQPVKMKFITKVYHPNVSSASGAICLDILKDTWSPVLTLKSTLISLQSLLCSPEPNDPQDAEVAKHYMTSRTSFEETARYWTKIYAGGEGSSGRVGEGRAEGQDEVALAGLEKAHVDRFQALGFSRDHVVSNRPHPLRDRPRLTRC